jgi:hypothetical protein
MATAEVQMASQFQEMGRCCARETKASTSGDYLKYKD